MRDARSPPVTDRPRESGIAEHGDIAAKGENARLEALELPVDGEFDEIGANLHPLIAFPGASAANPIVMLRSWSTESVYQQTLACHLGPDWPIRSFGPPANVDAATYPDSMEGWVDHFVSAFDRSGLSEIAALGGWSFGGTVAVEVAEILRRRGLEVPHVLMLDSRLPFADPARRPGTLGARYKRVMRRPRVLKRAIAAALRSAFGRPPSFDPLDVAPPETIPEGQQLAVAPSGYTISALSRAVQSAFVKYEPHATTLPLRLFSTRFSLRYTPGDPSLGWYSWAEGEFDVIEIPGGHWSMFRPEHVTTVCEEMRRILTRPSAT